jgi:hypothetical protein
LPRSRRESAPHKHFGPVTLFISYASEDRDLVDNITRAMNETFGQNLIIKRDVDIKQGKNWVQSIDEALDEADILLVVFTNKIKLSHSYAGYEVGYFKNSIQNRRLGSGGCNRIYIPFRIGDEMPESMQVVQNVMISAANVYAPTDASNVNDVVIKTKSSVVKLLNLLHDFVIRSDDGGSERQRPKLDGRDTELYNIATGYLQNCVSAQTYPERKLIIRTPTKPKCARNGANFSSAKVELVGDFSNILDIPERQMDRREHTWSEFGELVPGELKANLLLGIQKVAAAALTKDRDNYYFVAAPLHKKTYRLFVSEIITYVNNRTEVWVYLAQTNTKDYGDPYTTRLLKSINVGLRFRSLVLEEESEFHAEALGYPSVSTSQFKDKVCELLTEMDLVLNGVAEANINDPSFLIKMWGRGNESKVKQMIDTWEKNLTELYAAADGVLNSADDSGIQHAKEPFLSALRRFSADVETMNGEFTSRVLYLLAEKMEKTLEFYRAPYRVSNMEGIKTDELKNGSSVANGGNVQPPH